MRALPALAGSGEPVRQQPGAPVTPRHGVQVDLAVARRRAVVPAGMRLEDVLALDLEENVIRGKWSERLPREDARLADPRRVLSTGGGGRLRKRLPTGEGFAGHGVVCFVVSTTMVSHIRGAKLELISLRRRYASEGRTLPCPTTYNR